MADTKITGLAALSAAPDVADLLVLVDVSDTSMDAGGTDKKITYANLTPATTQLKVVDDANVIVTGDGQAIFCIPPDWNLRNLVDADIYVTTVSSSGLVTVQLRNVTDSVDMLSTKMTIDASEFTSFTAATPPVIDTAHDDVATGDIIAVDIDVAGTGAKGLGVILKFL